MDQRREWSFVFGCEGGRKRGGVEWGRERGKEGEWNEGGRDEEKYSPEHPGDL